MFLSSPSNPISLTNEPESLNIKRNNTSDGQSFEEDCLYSPDLVRRSSVRSSQSSKRDSRLAGREPIEPKPQHHHHHHHHHHYLTQASNDSRTLSIATEISPKNNYSRRKRRPSTSSVTSTVSVSSARSPAPTSSYFAPQPESSGFVARSPFAKRAPASRSSHGIETSSGPPPALSTQRSYTAEAARSSNSPAQQPPPRPRTEASSDLVKWNSIRFGTREPSECEDSTAASSQQKRVPVDQAMSTMDRTKVDAWARDDGDATIRAVDSAHTGNDDLFLRLARSNTTGQGTGDSVARSERRKVRRKTPAITHRDMQFPSRIELGKHRQNLSTNELPPSGTRPSSSGRSVESRSTTSFQARPATSDGWDRQQHSISSRDDSPKPDYRFLSRERPSAVSRNSHQHDDRSRQPAVTHQNSFSAAHTASNGSAEPERHNGRETLTPISKSGIMDAHSYRQSTLSYSKLRNGESVDFNGAVARTPGDDSSPETPRADDTESTASTTAPSTVWDELDDLKSRIRKLELTGKLPTTSGEAVSNGSGERPHTATTTVTTLSSSPKHRRGNSSSPSRSTVGGAAAAHLHPLLHTSLAKAKPLIGSEAYRALEATASDALSLAVIMGSGGPQGTLSSAASVVGAASVSERQIRRKADSMCRSLTELCIALCEIKTESVSTPSRVQATPQATIPNPSTSPNHQPPDLPSYRRSYLESQDPHPSTLTRSNSRALSRLEARRSSLAALNTPSTARSPLSELSTPTQDQPSKPKRHSLAPTLLPRYHRALANEEDNNDHDEDSPLRAPSRAMTSIGQPIRSSPREQRTPREYTSRHPLPNQTPPTIQRNNPQIPRRNHQVSSSFSTPPQLPASPHIQSGARRYLERSTPPAPETKRSSIGNSEGYGNLTEERARRIGSLGGYPSNGRTEEQGLGRNSSVIRRKEVGDGERRRA